MQHGALGIWRYVFIKPKSLFINSKLTLAPLSSSFLSPSSPKIGQTRIFPHRPPPQRRRFDRTNRNARPLAITRIYITISADLSPGPTFNFPTTPSHSSSSPSTMQIRPETDVLAQYGSPSRPISPASIPTPHKKTTMATGNERAGIENHTTESQAELEPRIQQQHSATLPSQLFPPELIDHIVDHLHDDKQSLIQCSKSSRVFSHATSYHLFRAVSIPSLQKCIEFQELISSSLHPLPSNSTPHLSSSPVPRATHHEAVPAHHDSSHLHPNTDRAYVHSHTRHTCASNYDLSIPGWDISKFVRKIEFLGLGSPSAIEDYVKLVKMLPRIREVAFGWWNKSAGLERIGRAFATISSANPSHHGSLPNQSFSSPSTNAFPETRAHAGDPLKVHLELVDFPSALTFLDFLGSFGGRVRELSLANVVIGGDDKDDIRGRFLPEIESVCLGYDGGLFGSFISSFLPPSSA